MAFSLPGCARRAGLAGVWVWACLAACGGEALATPEEAALVAAADEPVGADEIPLGVCLPLSGPFSTYGQSALVGVLARVDEWNRARPAGARRVHPVVMDNASSPDLARRQLERLAARRDPAVPASVGPLFAEALFAVQPVAEQARMVVITPLSVTRTVTHGVPWMFRSSVRSGTQALAVARFLVRNFGVSTAAILYDERYAVSRAFAGYFREAFAIEGGRVVAVEAFRPGPERPFARREAFEVEGTGADYGAALKAIAAARPEVLFIPCYAAEIIEIVQAVEAEPGLAGVRLCGPDLWDNQLVFDGAGRRLLGALFASSLYEGGLPYEPYRRFLESMRAAGVEHPDAQAASAYDAASLLLEALGTGETGEEVRAALTAMRRKPLATGATSMTERGDARKPVMIRFVEDRDGWPTPVYAGMFHSLPMLPSQEDDTPLPTPDDAAGNDGN